MRSNGAMFRSLSVCLSLLMLAGPLALAQKPAESSLRVVVTDPNGAAIHHARVHIKSDDKSEQTAETNAQGEAVFSHLKSGTARLRIEAAGFEPRTESEIALKAGSNQTEVRLEIAAVKVDVTVDEDQRVKSTDPRGSAFTNVLTEEQLAQLPDDPDEFENAINQLAGPDSTIRVNGFRGGKLPPKSQISQIRFRRNAFAAENHERSMVFVDVITKPGVNNWHGTMSFGFRDEALGARPVFAARRGPDQQRRSGFSLEGPLWKNHTSFFFNADSAINYDSKTIVAALPTGDFSGLILRPSRRLNISSRVEQAINKIHTLHFEYQRNAQRQDNLGVGDFDLAERAYTLDQAENIFRLSENGVFSKKYLNEFRFQARWQERDTIAANNSPALLVAGAFNRGGALSSGTRNERAFEVADNLDFSKGQHSMRVGVLLNTGSYRSNERSNSNGTFTFSSLDAFIQGRPTTYTLRTGDPLVSYSQTEFAWYWQDDWRVRKNFLFSYGVRHELQTHLSDHSNFAPRVGFAWTPTKKGTTTVRAGAGIFYDWYDTGTFEQTLRVNGTRQQDLVVRNPGYPNPLSGGAAQIILPPGRITADANLRQPTIYAASLGMDTQLFKRFRFGVDYQFQRGIHLLRSRNINAPIPGFGRPDPTTGNILEIESSATSTQHRFMINFGPSKINTKFFWTIAYMNVHSVNDSNGPLALPVDSYNLRGERGPAPNDIRHFFTFFMNRKLYKNFTLGMNFNANSAPPYNITTGFDNNGDTISNDRPFGVRRNSARGAARYEMGARLGWGFGFGPERKESAAGPMPVMVRIGGEGGGGISMPGASKRRFHLDFYAQAFNLLNHANLIGFSGVQTSPFFGHATSALPGRRIETGMRFSF